MEFSGDEIGVNHENSYHIVLLTIRLNIKNENYFLLLDPCATESYITEKLLSQLEFTKIPL